MPPASTPEPPQQILSAGPDMASERSPSRRPCPSPVHTGPESKLAPIPVVETADSSLPSSPDSQRSSPTLAASSNTSTSCLTLNPSSTVKPLNGASSTSLPLGAPSTSMAANGASSSSLTLVGNELDDVDAAIPLLQLQDPASAPSPSTLSRRTSTASLTPTPLKSPGTMEGAIKSLSNLSRRSSNSIKKVHSLVTSRRASSSHPRSRDGSVGPGLVRRRGSMNNSVNHQEQNNPFYTDSDDECAVEKDDCGSPSCVDGMYMNSNSSVTSSALSGPVIPPCMLKGTSMIKVGKKKNTKRITLTYDPMTVRIFWGKDWPSSSKAIYIDDIREIRTADEIGQYRLDSGLDESMSSRFFTILYTRRGQAATRALHVLADDEVMFSTWTTTLEGICKSRQAYATSLMAFDDKALKKWWQIETAKLAGDDKSRSPGEAKVDSIGVEHVCRSLHIHLPADKLRETIETVNGQKGVPDKLDFAEFLEFVHFLKARKDVRALYNQIAANSDRGITKDEFFRFLRDVQREDVDGEMEMWESVFARFVRKKKLRDAERFFYGVDEDLTISEGGLAAFLVSKYNSGIAREPQNYELNRPMNEYYISSSHNTYLLGWQVGGSSSHDGYITALQHGCRCVEIDCWDGPNDEPLVMHGRSWTTSISFREVIKTVNKYAFVKSRFPLWISLEVRCSLATQVNMAKIMIEIFDKKLVREPLHKNDSRLPAPSELLDRILIKVKEAQPLDEPAKTTGDRLTRRRGNSQPSPYQRPLPLEGVPVPSSPLLSPTPISRSTRHINRPNTITEGQVHHLGSEAESDSERDSTTKKYSSKIHPMLGELGVYCVGIQFDSFDSPEAKRFNHIFSFKEKTFAEKSQPGEQKRKLYLHNMRYMMRVYPNGGRINSSNFDPLIYWKRGVQMAALNWQTFDTGMQLNRAMFDGTTDQSGYVLKPIEGREFGVRHESLKVLNPDEGRDFKSRVEPRDMHSKLRKRARFTIRVISAQQLMRPFTLGGRRAMDPYVEVEVLLADDKRNKADATSVGAAPEAHKRRTKIAYGNGFNPLYEDVLDFDITTKYSDLIFVRFNVKLADKTYNDRAAPMATFTAKLSSLNQGYRTIPLHNPYGEHFVFSTLFCHVEKAPLEDVPFGFVEEAPKNGGKLNRFGRNVFPSSSTSPKTSIDSSRSS